MKTAAFPPLRVEPELREAAESVLNEGETLSGFVEQSIRANIERRRTQAEFIARGLAAREEARRDGSYVDADVVLARLQSKLERAKAAAGVKAQPRKKTKQARS
jgi:predicted transcriptional regulator